MPGDFIYRIFAGGAMVVRIAGISKGWTEKRDSVCPIFAARGDLLLDGRCVKMKKNYLRGSYTVEASIIVTVTILVLAALILCTFYIHDRATMQGIVCEAAAAGSNFAEEKDRVQAAQTVTERLDAGRFLGSQNVSGNAASGKREVTAQGSAQYPIPGFAANYLSGGSLDIRKSWTSRILDPANAIRKIKGAGELLTGGNE